MNRPLYYPATVLCAVLLGAATITPIAMVPAQRVSATVPALS